MIFIPVTTRAIYDPYYGHYYSNLQSAQASRDRELKYNKKNGGSPYTIKIHYSDRVDGYYFERKY